MTTSQTPETTATVTAISPGTPVRATWKQHGQPTSGFVFHGTEVKAPAAKGLKVAKVVTGPNGITLKGARAELATFAAATKFWAVVPADAPRLVAEPKQPAVKAEPLAPVQITAAKGGDQTVAPKTGAIAKAITATGKSVMAVSRDHGLNPSQMRRLAADTVGKVDLVRAQAIAEALGVELDALFGEATAKAKAATKQTPAPATPATPEADAALAAELDRVGTLAPADAEDTARLAAELGRVDTLAPEGTPAG